MPRYLLIESRSPWESSDVADFYAAARDLVAAGSEVTLFLVQNGVLAARKGAKHSGLAELSSKMKILADDFSLRERGIAKETLASGLQPVSIDEIVDLLAAGAKAVWH